MEFYVYSRSGFDAARPHEVPHVVISITSAHDDLAPVRANPARLGLLRLAFPDVEEPSARFPEESLFSAEHAAQIRAFVEQHAPYVARIVIHCDAGRSRSPAVAAALARVLTGDDAEFFGGRYAPNARVYRTLLAALEAKRA